MPLQCVAGNDAFQAVVFVIIQTGDKNHEETMVIEKRSDIRFPAARDVDAARGGGIVRGVARRLRRRFGRLGHR
jgi:hypothetical protein